MNIISIAAGCVLASALLPAHAQAPRFKPLVESEMSEAQLKAAREVASGPRGRLNPDGPSALLLRSPELMSRTQRLLHDVGDGPQRRPAAVAQWRAAAATGAEMMVA